MSELIKNVTVKEIAEGTKLKPAEANAMIKILEHFGVAEKTGVRHEASVGKGKRPSEYSIAANIAVTVTEDREVIMTPKVTELFKEVETADTEESVADSEVENV